MLVKITDDLYLERDEVVYFEQYKENDKTVTFIYFKCGSHTTSTFTPEEIYNILSKSDEDFIRIDYLKSLMKKLGEKLS